MIIYIRNENETTRRKFSVFTMYTKLDALVARLANDGTEGSGALQTSWQFFDDADADEAGIEIVYSTPN